MPSLYLNINDAALLFYNKSVLYLFALLLLSPLFGFVLPTFGKNKKTNALVLYRNFMFSVILGIVIYTTLHFQFPISLDKNILLGGLVMLSIMLIDFVSRKWIVVSQLIIFFCLIGYLAKSDANKVWEEKRTFRIVLSDNTRFLEENSKNSFYLASTSEYIFIYNSIQEQIIPLSKNQIKNISFHFKKTKYLN